ncbi:MAG: hypothetical protein CMD65_01610 [Gammaproteobacteria bacterium]|nr:hypothetical protein [Gammaproteobacteria bacterium]|tara:strand:- start:519 stop:1352 length:834 start_codon:yes stop_codon:yes gene_type:complete
MRERIITGSLALFFIILILINYNFYLFSIIFSLFALQAYNEWLRISKIDQYIRYILLFISAFFMYITIFYYDYISYIPYLLNLSLGIWLIISFDLIFNYKINNFLIKKYSMILGFYLIFSAWFLFISSNQYSSTNIINQNIIYNNDTTPLYILFLIIIVSLSDTSAYFVGKHFGKHKLSQIISPNKTIEGFIASIIIPVLIVSVIFNIYEINILFRDIIYIILISFSATIGDLFISKFKRIYNTKDSGNILPGHGGFLDRLDSYLPSITIFQFWLFL